MVETNLAPAGATDPDDINRIVGLTTIAWCMKREMHLDERLTPDLMTAFAPDGIVLANIDPKPVGEPSRLHVDSIPEPLHT